MTFALLCLFAHPAGLMAEPGPVTVSPDEKFLWSSYMICFGLNRDFSRQFHDRPLDRPPKDGTSCRLIELRNAAKAGIDAFSVDLFIADKNALGAFAQLVRLVREHHLPVGLSPMFDGYGRPGVSPDHVVRKIQEWFRRFAAEPCVVRCQGKPVIFTYAPYSLKPEQWRDILGRLRSAGCDGYWVGEFGRYLVLGQEPDYRGTRPWLRLFDALNTFPPMSRKKTLEVLGQYRSEFPGRPFVGSVRTGHWRPEVSVFLSQEGTRRFRESWRTVSQTGIRWLQQATWNDFSENHHLMPSENHSTTFCELNQYLASEWKGGPLNLDGPKLYLGQREEVAAGEKTVFEVLAVLRPEDVPAICSLRLTDAKGEILREYEPVRVAEAGIQAVPFSCSFETVPKERLVFPHVSFQPESGDLGIHLKGPYTIVSPSGYNPARSYSWINSPAHRQVEGIECGLELGGSDEAHRGQATVRVSSPFPLADVEVLHRGVQVFSLVRQAPEQSLKSPILYQARLPLNRVGQLNWGAYAVRAVTADGREATSRPVFVELPHEALETLGLWTFDAGNEAAVLDATPWLHDGRLGGRTRYRSWRPRRIPGPWNGHCLEFDGVNDRVLLQGPIVPPDAFTVEAWVFPEKRNGIRPKGQLIFSTAAAAVVLGLDPRGSVRVSRKSGGRWHLVEDKQPLPIDQWTHLAVTYDGAVMRLYRNGKEVSVEKVEGHGRCGQVTMGYNSVTRGAFFRGRLDEVRLSSRPLRPGEFGPHNPRKAQP